MTQNDTKSVGLQRRRRVPVKRATNLYLLASLAARGAELASGKYNASLSTLVNALLARELRGKRNVSLVIPDGY